MEAELSLPHERERIISRWARVGYVVVNGLASIGELVTGVLGGNVARVVDGMHGTAEIVIGNEQMRDAQNHDQVAPRRRRRIYTALASLGLAGAAVSGFNIATASHEGIDSGALDLAGTAFAATAWASAAGASLHLAKGIKSKYGSVLPSGREPLAATEADVIRHVVQVDFIVSSLATLSSAAAALKGYDWPAKHLMASFEEVFGAACGLWTAYRFRPTKTNMAVHPNLEATNYDNLKSAERSLDINTASDS